MFAKYVKLETRLSKMKNNVLNRIIIYFLIKNFIKSIIKDIEINDPYNYLSILNLFEFAKIVNTITDGSIVYNANNLSIRYYKPEYDDMPDMAIYTYNADFMDFKLSIKMPRRNTDNKINVDGFISYHYKEKSFTSNAVCEPVGLEYGLYENDNKFIYETLVTMVHCYCNLIEEKLIIQKFS